MNGREEKRVKTSADLLQSVMRLPNHSPTSNALEMVLALSGEPEQ